MKSTLLLAFFGLVGMTSHTQIVLTAADLPVIGDQAAYREIDSTSTSPGPSGANQTWNFSFLTGGYADTLFYLDPVSTPAGAAFPTSDICEKHGDDNYEYWDNTASGMKLVGFDSDELVVLDIQGYKFPLLTYGSTLNHNFRAKFNVVSADTYDATYLVHQSTADAWGTLTTPAGTVNALRIYTTETRYDSSYTGGTGTQTAVTTGYYYKWYAKGLGWPVLEITHGTLGEPDYEKTMYATDLSGVTGISEIPVHNSIGIYPNPFHTSVTISAANPLDNVTLVLLDGTGRMVYSLNHINGSSTAVNMPELCRGIYYYRLTDETGNMLASGTLATK